MLRVIGVAFLLFVAGCGTPPGESSDPVDSTTPEDPVVTTSLATPVTTLVTSTSSTTSALVTTETPPRSDAADDPGSPLDLDLSPGIPIDPPENFPSLVQLEEMVDYFNYPEPGRVRISSRRIFGAEWTETVRQNSDPGFSGTSQIIITYYDDLTIWDFDSGLREVAGRGGVLSLADDGTWRESDSELWPFAPLFTWSDGQSGAEGLFRLNPVVVGYELLGDRPTVRLRSGEAPADVWADMWLDATGVALRVVYDVSSPGEQDQMWLVWDVQDIGPETDLGPLPPNP